jgi:hypothetical protein
MTFFFHFILRLLMLPPLTDKDGKVLLTEPTVQTILKLIYDANPLSDSSKVALDISLLRLLLVGNMELPKKFCLTCALGRPEGIRDIKCLIDNEVNGPFDTCAVWEEEISNRDRILREYSPICLPNGVML